MSNPILLITGGNAGLGYLTVEALCQSSKAYTILLGGRSLDKAKNAVQQLQKDVPQSSSTVKAVQIDIEDDASIKRLFEDVSEEFGRLDILINNAGASLDTQFTDGTLTMREMWNKSWNVNTTGTYITTHTFAPLLLQSGDPRLLFIASGTSTLTETESPAVFVNRPEPKGWPKPPQRVTAYRSSKAGMNMMMREWTRMLKEDGVKVWAVSPGFLATGLGGDAEANRRMGAIDPRVGAGVVRGVVEGERDGDVGKVVRRDSVQPW